MHPDLVFAVVLVGTLGWIALPFIPAIMELARPRDASPLDAVGNDSGRLTYFATTFAERVAGIALAAPDARVDDVVRLADGETLPDDTTIAVECMARADFTCGVNGNFRALLGEREVVLGAGTTVQRWVHANGRLLARSRCRLIGRATSDESIILEDDVQFDRLDAPIVRVVGATVETVILPLGAYTPFLLVDADSMATGYWRVRGDLVIPANMSVTGSLVVTGNVRIGEGARIEGAVKAHGTMHVSARAVLVGSVSARGRIVIANGARLSGPVISETEVAMGAAVVGVPGRRTTVTAPRIYLGAGAVVYGAVMSADGGVTVSARR